MTSPELRHMRPQPRWAASALLPLAVGLLWLVCGWQSGIVLGIVASVPGVVLVGAGVALLLWPGDRQVTHWLTLVAALGCVLAVAIGWLFGWLVMALLLLGDALCVLLGAYTAVHQQAVPHAVPLPRMSVSLLCKVALDEGMLAFFMLTADIPRARVAQRNCEELRQMQALGAGCTEAATAPWWAQPGAPETTRLERTKAAGHTFEWLAFDSGYAPPDTMPGALDWQQLQPNQHMYARVFRHDDGPRPWLLCIHGYQMGTPGLDLSLFPVEYFHHTLGLNLIQPVLPLHGPRRVTRISGGHFLDGSITNLFHAQAQTLWDLRRCLAWLRTTQDADRIGVLGYSLGGYHAALLAAFEPQLAAVIAGIPMTDIPATLWRHLPLLHVRYLEACGLQRQGVSEAMAPLSPLRLAPRVPWERRFIIAASGDQLVPPEQPLALWQHWQQPAMHWYPGTHLSVRRERSVNAFVEQALQASGLGPATAGSAQFAVNTRTEAGETS